ncbi:MAG: tetratricopeptide repeat protein [Pseudobdellovibrionaceae bacterium]
MKTRALLSIGLSLMISASGSAQSKNKQSGKTGKSASKKSSPANNRGAQPRTLAQPPSFSSMSQKQLSEALTLVRNAQYEQAIPKLFSLSRKPDLASERMQIKYILGVSLMESKFYQIAAFQFVDVIRNGNSKYTKQAIEKLSIVADELGDDSLLNYAITKVQLEDFPDKYKDMIYYRLGEIKLKNGQPMEAAQAFAKVGSTSRYYAQAKFNRGRAFLEAKQPNEALRAFNALLNSRSQAPVTDTNKVAAELAIARTYYQAQQWDEAIEWYRKVPRDTEFWHAALFEESWAFLRAARFRSALSNFQSLHSAYYEDFYIPESLLLRAIVYLYICKYDEMEKVLGLFEKTYGPVRTTIGDFMQSNRDPMTYYQEIEKTFLSRKDNKAPTGLRIPYNVAKFISDEGDVKRAFTYMKSLAEEKRRLDSHSVLGHGAFASYANKILANRARNTRISIGEMTKAHLTRVRTDLRDLYEQAGFIRYEMINGQKEQLKKKIAGKDISGKQIDENVNREFYIQNGYEYWPFDGEYWLDEIGNYHYLGKQSCE